MLTSILAKTYVIHIHFNIKYKDQPENYFLSNNNNSSIQFHAKGILMCVTNNIIKRNI